MLTRIRKLFDAVRTKLGGDAQQVPRKQTRYSYTAGPMYFIGQQIVRKMQDAGYPARIYCCYRTPHEQEKAFDRKVSKARPFQSPHQFYEAVDIIHPDKGWEPDDPGYWDMLKAAGQAVANKYRIELEFGHDWGWDSAHIELKDWREFSEKVFAINGLKNSVEAWDEQQKRDARLSTGKDHAPLVTERDLMLRFNEVLPAQFKQHIKARLRCSSKEASKAIEALKHA